MDVVERAKAMILSPAAEWRRIEPEPGGVGDVFVPYVALLAAIPPVCALLRRGLFGWGPRLHHLHHHGLFTGVTGGIGRYLATFVALYVMALAIDGLAPNFSARRNPGNALKLAVYAMTPVWLAGVFVLVPGLGFLRLLALVYAVYLIWLGLPVLMTSPPDRTAGYTLAVFVCAVILSVVVAAFVGPIV